VWQIPGRLQGIVGHCVLPNEGQSVFQAVGIQVGPAAEGNGLPAFQRERLPVRCVAVQIILNGCPELDAFHLDDEALAVLAADDEIGGIRMPAAVLPLYSTKKSVFFGSVSAPVK